VNAEPFLAEIARHLHDLHFDVVLIAISPSWNPWRRPVKKRNARRRALAALRRESDRALVDLIRRRLALPLEKRMNFLRRRIGVRGSAL
jgi:hypothetical protein